MAEITLADYAGYIFREMIRAREMADTYSRSVAEAYAKDAVLRHFSVPRFKVPSMQLTIPVLVSGARYAQAVRFTMSRDNFLSFILGQVREVVGSVQRTVREPFRPVRRVPPDGLDPRVRPLPFSAPDDTLVTLANEFWHQLDVNPDPSRPNTIVETMWTQIFEEALLGQDLAEQYKKSDPENNLLRSSTAAILQTVGSNTTVSSSDIKSLLVNPETNIVKSGSSESSVFIIKVDMTEEGFYIREAKDDETGEIRSFVEFE